MKKSVKIVCTNIYNAFVQLAIIEVFGGKAVVLIDIMFLNYTGSLSIN